MMIKSILLTLCVVMMMYVSSSTAQDPSDAQLFAAFINWAQNYNVQYDSSELQAKFAAWKANAQFIANYNANNNVADMAIDNSAHPAAAQEAVLGELNINAGEVVTFPSESVSQMNFNQFSDLTFQEFEIQYTGGVPDANAVIPGAVAAGAVLSTGAIIGIAVGGAAAVAGVTGASVAIIKKKRAAKKTVVAMEEVAPQKSSAPKVDIFKFENPHHSITARAVAITSNSN
ncbi:hypothetical protein DFA_08913 [Cavenderia fasciculata]|uniref:Cathepsin propeptide inhibitor domain-containing protein n=1 Tax=Cavenderia fasciculata TaxID=261658 RepID=F4Q519_CACFS|nr:uncharacterized protein DFA_08913 [Cavenderia fasciculata]EGG17912.1 hypothetical protein DFA_08913 [Cavenderia fasciculata]|eukprot:XP_004356396.1 hypothetical protein DFA_08913 [Cavenderia fasciculata]